MDASSVQGALVVTPRIYGFDNIYAINAARLHPDRFAVIGRIDPYREDIAAVLHGWQRVPGMRGARIGILPAQILNTGRAEDLGRFWAASEKDAIPVCIYAPYNLEPVAEVARQFPTLNLVIDHMGFPQPPLPLEGTDHRARLDELVALARLPNVAVKVSGLPNVSDQAYPFADVHRMVVSVLSAFGADRLMWGSGSIGAGRTYEESVNFIADIPQIAESDLRLIMGATARRIFGWPSSRAPV